MILRLCLATDGFDKFPTLLVTDDSCMIDRRLGIHGHPLEIQAPEESSASITKALNDQLCTDSSLHGWWNRYQTEEAFLLEICNLLIWISVSFLLLVICGLSTKDQSQAIYIRSC